MSTVPVIEGVYTDTTRVVQFQDYNGVNYLTIRPIKTQLTTSIDGATVAEAMHRNRHIDGQAPIVHDVGDGNVTGSMAFYVEEYPIGTSADVANPLAWLEADSAAAAGLVSTGKGNAWCFRMKVLDSQPGKIQTTTYNYVYPEKPAQSFDNGLLIVTFNFTDRERVPTVVAGDTTAS
jgi:hypothetical protein